MESPRILITGANGQIGTVLVNALREKYGRENVIASDIKESHFEAPFEILDITKPERLKQVIGDYNVTCIYHLAALLSSKGEQNIQLTWQINLQSYLSILDISMQMGVKKIFYPSTIGIYGHTTPKTDTPQNTSFIPETVYGISKYTGELWSNYYRVKKGLDIRSIRYPGVISYQTIPVGGTTDYSVEMFFEAVKHKKYTCYLNADTRLPMIYMPDVINATLQLMSVPIEDLNISMAYNLSGFSLTPALLTKQIQRHIPEFQTTYEPDHRQQIAESWSESIDDQAARNDWNWKPSYNVDQMVDDMILNIKR